MTPRYKLLALDLDGTALGADPQRFAPGLLEAASAAAEAGVEVLFATGRPRPCMPAELQALRPAWLHTLVCCDGAQIWDEGSGALLWQQALDAAALAEVAAICLRLGLPVEYIDAEGWYHLSPQHRAQLLGGPLGSYHRGVLAARGVALEQPAPALAARGVVKINLPRVPAAQCPLLEQALQEAGVQAMPCAPGSYEVAAASAGKRAAVAFAARRLGLTLADVMAVGDSGNDAALLAAAGLGIAMGNAPPAVQAAAQRTAPPNTEGGAAWAIRRWLLEE